MILAADFHPLTHGASGGVIQWLEGILGAYAEAFPEDRILLFVPSELPLAIRASANVERFTAPRRDLPELADGVLRDFSVDILVRVYPELVFPNFPDERQIVIIPDMQHAELPGNFTATELRFRRLAFGYLLSKVAAIGTMTAFTRKSILRNPWATCEDVFLMPPAVAFNFGASDNDYVDESAATAVLQDFSSYFFMPANPWPHKNHRNLLRAFALARSRLPPRTGLVFTGAGDWKKIFRGYEHLPVRNLGYLSRREIAGLYRRATALTYFSTYEGFGMPLLEAFHFGTPVICSNIPALSEVGGDATLQCRPDDVEAAADLMVRVAAESELRRELASRGRKQLSRFTWRASAQALRDAAIRVLERPGRSLTMQGDSPLSILVLIDLTDRTPTGAEALRAIVGRSSTTVYLLVDENSPAALLEGLLNDASVQIIDCREGNAAIAANQAVTEARCELILFLRGDCILVPGALDDLARYFGTHPECDVLACATNVDRRARTIETSWRMPSVGAQQPAWPASPIFQFEESLLGVLAGDFRSNRPLIVWRRRAHDLVGGFDPAFSTGYDVEHYLKLIEAGCWIEIVDRSVATIRLSVEEPSAQRWYAIMKDIRRSVGNRRGRLKRRFIRLLYHRRLGLEPAVTGRWNLALCTLAFIEDTMRTLQAQSTAPIRTLRRRRILRKVRTAPNRQK